MCISYGSVRSKENKDLLELTMYVTECTRFEKFSKTQEKNFTEINILEGKSRLSMFCALALQLALLHADFALCCANGRK